MPLARIGTDLADDDGTPIGWKRTFSVRAPVDWYRGAVDDPLPLYLFLTGGTSIGDFAAEVGVDRFFRGENHSAWGGGGGFRRLLVT